jgi:choline-sulfatase
MKTKTGSFLQFIPSSALCLILICAQLNEHSISKAQTHSNRTAIILISVDTLRADSLSCYGSRQSVTSEIDLLTAGGTLFSQVSSTYPLYHGVEDNGQSIPSSLPTLATILKSHGYRTAGFVGSFVLDQRFGMSRGFDFYDSPYDLHRRTNSRFLDSRRFGEDVVQNAEHWIAANAQEPFFVFIHLYDMHKPF